jgi:hypothetical protein
MTTIIYNGIQPYFFFFKWKKEDDLNFVSSNGRQHQYLSNGIQPKKNDATKNNKKFEQPVA